MKEEKLRRFFVKVVNEKEKQEELASRYTEVEDKLEAQARKLMVACSENTQDLKKLHSKEEMANIQTRNTEVATPWKAMPSSVRWREDSPSLGVEGCSTSCSSLCLFPRQLRRSLLQCTRWFCPPLYSIQKGRRLLPWRMRQLLTG